jgi:hypothetical protein
MSGGDCWLIPVKKENRKNKNNFVLFDMLAMPILKFFIEMDIKIKHPGNKQYRGVLKYIQLPILPWAESY